MLSKYRQSSQRHAVNIESRYQEKKRFEKNGRREHEMEMDFYELELGYIKWRHLLSAARPMQLAFVIINGCFNGEI